MPVTRLSIEDFLDLSVQYPVLDVRSPGEYGHAHIPGAVSFPLFSDEERKVVGTTYKQVSREAAIKIGLDYFGPKMCTMVEFAEKETESRRLEAQKNGKQEGSGHPEANALLIHCWRGGMRSGAVAWLMDLYGFRVYTLEGGYKSFRNWVLRQFQVDFNFRVIGGYTGSGKTLVLDELKKKGYPVLDLEGIANHKGSAFGGLDKPKQPSTEMFENTIAFQVHRLVEAHPGAPIWVEDESQRIGDINTPIELWNRFREKPLVFLDIPFEKRLDYIVRDYGKNKKDTLINAIVRIQKRLGGLEAKAAVNCLLEDDTRGCFEILLRYYDKHYLKALHNRPNLQAVKLDITAEEVNPEVITQKILNYYDEPILRGK